MSAITIVSKSAGLLLVECGGFCFRVSKEAGRRRGSGFWCVRLDGQPRNRDLHGDRSCADWGWFDRLNRGFDRPTQGEALLALTDFMSKRPAVLDASQRIAFTRHTASRILDLVSTFMPLIHERQTKAGREFMADVEMSGSPVLFEVCIDLQVYAQLRWHQRNAGGLWRLVTYTPKMGPHQDYGNPRKHKLTRTRWSKDYPGLTGTKVPVFTNATLLAKAA